MDQQLKQRLVGAIIIVSLVVIFVPMLFEEEQDGQGTVGAGDIPELPKELDARAIDLPKSAADAAPSEGGEKAYTGYRIIPLTDGDSAAVENDGMPPGNLDEDRENGPDFGEDLDPEAAPQAVGEAQSRASGGLDGAAVASGPEPVKDGIDSISTEAPVAPSKTKPKSVGAKATEKEPKKPKSAKASDSGKSVSPQVTSRKSQTAKSASANQKAVSPESVSKTAENSSKSTPTGGSPGLPVAKAPVETPDDMAVWVVQAGSFTTEGNARSLAEKLRKSNFPAFVEVVTNAGNSIYRVHVGPELNRTRAEQVQKRIEDSVGVKGIVVPHP